MPGLSHICLPVNLDAFVLNQEVCTAKGLSLVAPITQPNYAGLRLSSTHVQHDVQPSIDLHNARIGANNPRIASTFSRPFVNARETPEPKPDDLGAVDKKRLGIYLHWTVPRAYRSAKSAAAPPGSTQQINPDAQPKFPLVPNRWLVVRTLRDGWTPASAKPTPQKVTAWVIESDRVRKVEELSLDENGETIDLETDVAPFVAYAGANPQDNADLLNSQAQIYLGCKTKLESWREKKPRKSGGKTPDPLPGFNYTDLTVMNSSNPAFADYQPHNGNVFSIKDNLCFAPGQYLESATCDYVVLGWHSDFGDDPLWIDTKQQLEARLQQQFCATPLVIQSPAADPAQSAGGAAQPPPKPLSDPRSTKTDATRLICHAAKYGVVYSSKRPAKTAADTYANNFTKNIDMEPVSVGTSPLDAMLAFFNAHSDPKDTTLVDTLGDTGSQTAKDIMGIRELLYATEDDYNSRVKAADLVFANNFARLPGGSIWRYSRQKSADGRPNQPSNRPPDLTKQSDPKSTPADPKAPQPGAKVTQANSKAAPPDPLKSLSEAALMSELNNAQRQLDSALWKLDLIRWNLFAEWFKFVSDPLTEFNKDRPDIFKSRIAVLRPEAAKLADLRDKAQAYVTKLQTYFDKSVNLKKAAQEPYFKRNDPSLCLAGIDAGWDPDYLNNTPTRFVDKLNGGKPVTPDANVKIITDLLKDVNKYSSDGLSAPGIADLPATLISLLNEASMGPPKGSSGLGFKTWSSQPFSPQFVEWVGTYYHIPWTPQNWDLQLTTSALAASNHKQVMYCNPNKLPDPKTLSLDSWTVSGRMMVLPQPSFALGATVAQVLVAANDDVLSEDLKKPEGRDKLIAAARSMKFISGELTGLTNALLTMSTGQHVKPNLRQQGNQTIPMKAAVDVGAKIGMVLDDFKMIDGESGRTPYGTLFRFPEDANAPSPFKAVQHGQFAITNLVIVDKFGQSIACPFPKRKARPGSAIQNQIPDFVHPCLSEQLVPSLLKDGTLNTVFSTTDTKDSPTLAKVPMTPFVQLTPAINQEARMNASFLKITPDGKSWQACNEWDNPIFGWVIVNYPDSALQFFTADGTYYTSRQFGGPLGTIKHTLWLPFEPPAADKAKTIASPQLVQLIGKLADVDYCKVFWDTITKATPSMPFPPSDYAPYANAIVGKPLALVNAGWSLELAQPPLWRQNTLPTPKVADLQTGDPLRNQARQDMAKYSFKVKIGDAERPFDGVVAYWDVNKGTTKTNLDKTFAYSTLQGLEKYTTIIEPKNYPTLTPYFLDPEKFDIPSADNLPADANNALRPFEQQHNAQLMVKTLLIDPYAPIHVYAGILPIKSLQLSQWAITQGLKQMMAFFTMGPLLIPMDVPATYDAANKLNADTWMTLHAAVQTNAAAQAVDDPIKLPIAGTKGMWNWLQPYMVGTGADASTHYNSLSVGQEDGKLRLEPAPYTLVEGFLSLSKPLVDLEVPSA